MTDTPESPDATDHGTARDRAKAVRRQQLLDAAARLMAQRGYAGVRLEDIGAAVGVSGPAMYRHFAGKHDVLAQMLVGISQRLFDGGEAVVDEATDLRTALSGLIDFHVDFVLTEPDLIRVQDRDLSSLDDTARHQVRSLQRRYVELWTDILVGLNDSMEPVEARARAHAVFGLLNSAPRLPDLPQRELRSLLTQMANGALS